MAWIAKQGFLTEEEAINNSKIVISTLLAKGWTRESADSLCGNMWGESSVNPLAENGIGAYGLVQWYPKDKYTDWAAANNLKVGDGDSQVKRIIYEVENNLQWMPTAKYDMSFSDFVKNTKKLSHDELTEVFIRNYERPGEADIIASLPKRQAFTRKIADIKIDGSTGDVEYTDGTQLALLPIDVINITQGELGPYSHFMGSKNEYGIDFTVPGQERYPLHAPCDSEVISVMLEYAQVCWKASRPVMCADGQIREIWYRIVHDWNADKWKVGDTIKKGELIGHTGSAGMSSGDHLHLDVFKYKKGVLWSSQLGDFDEMLHNYDVFAINNVKKIIEDKGYNWRKSDYVDTVGGSTPGTDTDKKKDNTIELLLCNALNGWYNY